MYVGLRQLRRKQFCTQLLKAYMVKKSYDQLLIDTAMQLLTNNSPTLKSVAMSLYAIISDNLHNCVKTAFYPLHCTYCMPIVLAAMLIREAAYEESRDGVDNLV